MGGEFLSVEEKERLRGRIRGSLLGGAVGDALGYAVEFISWNEIRREYGRRGIQSYACIYDPSALISDDTQMTLFTANGLLTGESLAAFRDIRRPAVSSVYLAYLDWLKTQKAEKGLESKRCSWLCDIPELYSRRAPGMTCLSALQSGEMGTMENPLNSSKGCGGVMRVAPIALYYKPESEEELRELDVKGAQAAAITHGHPLGYLPAAVLTHIISRGVYGGMGKDASLKEAVIEAWETVRSIFQSSVSAQYLDHMEELLDLAVSLAEAGGDDEKNIRRIGGGWVGDEALAIAVYCCLRYPRDFSACVTAAVNHSGDSDSTGAVAGNILGAWLGYDAIEEKWKKDLELRWVILEMADDLFRGCPVDASGRCSDPVWECKYCEGTYVRTEQEALEVLKESDTRK